VAIPSGKEPVLELGSGAGFLRQYIPDLITSEVFRCPGVDLVLDATHLPIADASLRGIVMTDVLHHIRDSRSFFSEATRCVRPGGVIAMIEPWVTPWSRLVYTKFHHEPFQPKASKWELPEGGLYRRQMEHCLGSCLKETMSNLGENSLNGSSFASSR